jgi:hypothetical protein
VIQESIANSIVATREELNSIKVHFRFLIVLRPFPPSEKHLAALDSKVFISGFYNSTLSSFALIVVFRLVMKPPSQIITSRSEVEFEETTMLNLILKRLNPFL